MVLKTIRRLHPEWVGTFQSWSAAKNRCYSPSDISYPAYGGRGIRMAKDWRADFWAFARDMGQRPPDCTLDRFPNNDGNYEKGNCRWATAREQQGNKNNNHKLTHDGRTQNIVDWARETGISPETLWKRIEAGWPVARILTTPAHPRLLVTYRGETKRLTVWARLLKLSYHLTYYRLQGGWTVERAFTEAANNAPQMIEYNGETRTMVEWARILGVPKHLLRYRLNAGWSVQRAFTQVSDRRMREHR